MSANLQSQLNQLVSAYERKRATVVRAHQEACAASGVGITSGDGGLTEALQLVKPVIVDGFISLCEKEAKEQLEDVRSGLRQTQQASDPYRADNERRLLAALAGVFQGFKTTCEQESSSAEGITASAHIDATETRVSGDVRNLFQEGRSDFARQIGRLVASKREAAKAAAAVVTGQPQAIASQIPTALRPTILEVREVLIRRRDFWERQDANGDAANAKFAQRLEALFAGEKVTVTEPKPRDEDELLLHESSVWWQHPVVFKLIAALEKYGLQGDAFLLRDLANAENWEPGHTTNNRDERAALAKALELVDDWLGTANTVKPSPDGRESADTIPANIGEAVTALGQFKQQFRDARLAHHGEYLLAEWHSRLSHIFKEGGLWLPSPSGKNELGYVHLREHGLGMCKVPNQPDLDYMYSAAFIPAADAFRKIAREAGDAIERMEKLAEMLRPFACGEGNLAAGLDRWWYALLFRLFAPPIVEKNYNDGGVEYETVLPMDIFKASILACDKAIEILLHDTDVATPVAQPVAVPNTVREKVEPPAAQTAPPPSVTEAVVDAADSMRDSSQTPEPVDLHALHIGEVKSLIQESNSAIIGAIKEMGKLAPEQSRELSADEGQKALPAVGSVVTPPETRYLDLIVNKDRQEIGRKGYDRTIKIFGPNQWELFVSLFGAGERGLTAAEVNKLSGEQSGRRNLKSNLKTSISPLDITIPDREWKLVEVLRSSQVRSPVNVTRK